MTIPVLIAAGLAGALLALHWVSLAIAAVRCHRTRPADRPSSTPPVTIVRPLKGLEPFCTETIEASFRIDWPQYELLFCIADAHDPVAPLVRAAISRHPAIPARLLTGVELLGSNPKLNNMAKGFREARHDIIVFTDSNLLVEPDYLRRLMANWRPGAGMVTAPAYGDRPQGFWAEVECAMLNSWQARVQYAVDTFGFGFAQGKTLMYRRADLERGGLEALADEPAEDAASTKLMRAGNRGIAVAGPPYAQLIGPRNAAQVWGRHVRWARLRRASFPLLFGPEILAGALPALACAFPAALATGAPALPAILAGIGLWYLPEWALCRLAGWPSSARTIVAMAVRDALLPAIWIAALSGRSVSWHGHEVTLAPARSRRRIRLTPAFHRLAWPQRFRSARFVMRFSRRTQDVNS